MTLPPLLKAWLSSPHSCRPNSCLRAPGAAPAGERAGSKAPAHAALLVEGRLSGACSTAAAAQPKKRGASGGHSAEGGEPEGGGWVGALAGCVLWNHVLTPTLLPQNVTTLLPWFPLFWQLCSFSVPC